MSTIKDKTIEGFNTFLDEQKKVPGETTISLVQFDTKVEKTYLGHKLADAPRLTDGDYAPYGWTALLDAVGGSINAIGARLHDMQDDERPERVLVVIITDGMENSSSEFVNKQIADMIAHQTSVYKWKFVFIGANQDSFATAQEMNIDASSTLNFCATPYGTGRAFAALGEYVSVYRCASKPYDVAFSAKNRADNAKATT